MKGRKEMNANELINSYFKYLENNTAIINHEDGWSEILLPFMDNHRDFLDLFMRQDEETKDIIITDNGDTFSNLELRGIDVSDYDFESIVSSANAEIQNKEITMVTSKGNFPWRFIEMVQAILAVQAVGNSTFGKN